MYENTGNTISTCVITACMEMQVPQLICKHTCVVGLICTCVIRAGQSAKNYRERATEIKHLKNELAELTRQLAVARTSLAYNQKHQDSIKEYRRAALDALEQRNVTRDKLKTLQQELDRWQAKYVCACTF